MAHYLDYFGLNKPPFSMTLDPSFAFATLEHEQALSKMTFYTDEHQGLFLLMGEIGTGKNQTEERRDEYGTHVISF